jgi:hypothetical protein
MRDTPAFTGVRIKDADPSYSSDEAQHTEEEEEDEDQDEEEYIPLLLQQGGQAVRSESKRDEVSLPQFADVSDADEAKERAIVVALLESPARQRSIKKARRAWTLADNFEKTYPGPQDGDNGVGPLGSVDKNGLSKVILPWLAQERTVVDLGSGTATTALAFATRHSTIAVEIVPSRFAYGKRLHKHFLQRKPPLELNELIFGTHKRTRHACAVRCLLSVRMDVAALATPAMARRYRGQRCSLCEDNGTVRSLCRTLFCVFVGVTGGYCFCAGCPGLLNALPRYRFVPDYSIYIDD